MVVIYMNKLIISLKMKLVLQDLVELARNYSGYDPFDDEASMTGRVRDTLVCEVSSDSYDS